MEKVTVILAHADLNTTSLMNKTIKDTLTADLPDVRYRHLDTLYPGGRIDTQAEQQALLDSDIIVMQFPVQWYMPPALMKAYMDSVWVVGFAYGEGAKLKGKQMFLIATTGSSEESYSPGGKPENYNRQYLKNYLFAFENMAGYMGMTYRGLVAAHCAGVGPEFAGANKEIAAASARRFAGLLKNGGKGCTVL